VLAARRRAEAGFVYPPYRRPGDLIEIRLGEFDPEWSDVTIWGRVADGKLAPYYTRRQIDGEKALAGRGLELAWLDDPVARYFMATWIRASLRAGRRPRSPTPGSPVEWQAVHEHRTERSRTSASSARSVRRRPRIQAYLRAHPERRDDALFRNERYVFFAEAPTAPVGRLGVKLTDGRSIAVDPSFYPLDWLAYIETTAPVVDPSGKMRASRPLRRLMLMQDSGAAITGPGRADIFFGTGEQSGLEAGSMSQRGEFYLLTPVECHG
jgi:membrane-bound lytic murein transglycosylase A